MINTLTGLTLWGNSLWAYCIFVSLVIAGFLTVKVIETVIIARLKKWAEKTTTTFDDFIVKIIKKIALPLAYFSVLYLSANILALSLSVEKAIKVIATTVITISVVRLAVAFLNYGLQLYLSRREKNESLKRSLDGILVVAKVIIWGTAVIFFLDNLGFKISAVIAGLGIGGVAVALAAQVILGDLFSYFAILFDRPFEVGDFIIIGDYLGAVEHIGIKTTRIRSLGGEQLIFSNSDLTNSRVRNYKRMDKRRVVFKLGVTYQTTSRQVQAIPKIIETTIKSIKDTVFDRAHFFSYGDFSLIYEVVYYVLGSDYNKYMDIQQEINFAIKDKFEKEKIEFAYPTQTLFVTKNQE